MYHGKTITVGAAGTGVLAHTGMNSVFYVVAAFTLVMAGIALTRLVPKRER